MKGREPFAMIPFALLRTCRDAYALHLYARLRSHANQEGLARTDTGQLAHEIGASPSTFKRALGNLRDLGFIKTRRRHASDGSVCGLSFYVFETCQTVKSDLQVKSGLKVSSDTTKGSKLTHSKEVDLKNIDLELKAGAPAPPPCGKPRNDAPTEGQIWALLTSIADAEGFADLGELNHSLRAHAAQLPGFDYAADIDLVNRVLNKFVAAADRRAARR